MGKGSAWITQTAPISLKDQLIPIFDILCNFNDLPWFESLRQMLGLIPDGFPVRIDIPLFYVLTARVTFQNINSAEGEGCTKDDQTEKITINSGIFDIPTGYSVTYSNMNENIKRQRRERQREDPELDMAINQS